MHIQLKYIVILDAQPGNRQQAKMMKVRSNYSNLHQLLIVTKSSSVSSPWYLNDVMGDDVMNCDVIRKL